MKNMARKLIVFIMVLAMLLEAAPVSVFAESAQPSGKEDTILPAGESEGKQLFGSKEDASGDQASSEAPIEGKTEDFILDRDELRVTQLFDKELDALSAFCESRSADAKKGGEQLRGAKSGAKEAADASQKLTGFLAYEIEPTVELNENQKYTANVTLPAAVEISKEGNVTLQLFHIVKDTAKEITGFDYDLRDGVLYGFSFETEEGFSPFVLKYTVDFVYIEKKAEITIDLDKLQKNGNELGQLIQKNSQELEEIAVADILNFIAQDADNQQLSDKVYTLSLSNATALSDFDADFFSAAGVDIEGEGVEYGSGKITLRENFESAKVTFVANHRTLELALENYTKPIPPIAYAFHGVGVTASISEILASAGIVSSYYNTTVSDETAVSIDGDTLTTLSFFDEVTLTLTLTLEDESTVTVLLGNPEFIPANTPVQSEAGSFVPGIDLAPGAELKAVEAEENRAVTEQAKAELGEDAQVKFYNLSIEDAEGNKLDTGATVTLNLGIELDVPDGEFAKVTGFVYHVTDEGIVPLDATFALDGKGIASVTFSTDGFSLFGIAYTVEFVTGGVTWSWPGQGSYKIADILAEIGVTGTIQSVSLKRTVDQGGAENALYLSDDHTELISEEAFQDTFELTVVVDGKTYVITVKDTAGDNFHTVIIQVDPTVTWEGHLYFVLKQEGVSWYQDQWNHAENLTQYYVGEIPQAGGTIKATTFKVAHNGATDNPYDNSQDITAQAAVNTNSMSQTLDSSTPINYAAGVSYVTNINGISIVISIDNVAETTTITIGNVGPVTYTATINFFDAWNDSPKESYTLSGSHTLTANDGTNTYTATITASGAITFDPTLPDGELTWTLDGTTLTESTSVNLDGYFVTGLPNKNTSNHTYTFEAHQPEYYTASINFYEAGSQTPDTNPTVPSGYTLEANDGIDTYIANVVNGTLSFTKGGTPVAGLPKDKTFTWTLRDSSSQATTQIGDYNFTGPSPDNTTHTYVFSARKPQVCTAALTVTGGDPDTTTEHYYIVTRKNDQNIGFAEITATADPLTFSDGTNNITPDDNTSFWIVKSDNAITALIGFESVNDADKLTAPGTLGSYIFDWSLSGTVYGFTATKDIGDTLAITFLQADGSTTDSSPTVDGTYYLLVNGNYNYKYYAPLTSTGFGTIYDANGTSVPGMKDIQPVSFEIVKAASAPNNINDLTSLTKIGNGGTIGEYYTVAIPSSADGNQVFQFTATKQQPHTVSIQFKDSEDEDIEAPSFESGKHYYLVAKVNGERIAFAEVTGNSNALMENLPDVTFELVKTDSVVNALTDLQSATTVTAFTASNATEYNLGTATLNSTVYSFTPTEMSGYRIAFRFLDTAGQLVNSPTVPEKYYVLFRDDNNRWYSSEINDNGTMGSVYDSTPALVATVPQPKQFIILNGNTQSNYQQNPAAQYQCQQSEQVMDGGLLGDYIITFPTMEPAPVNGKYVFIAEEAPNYSANIHFVEADGTTPISNPGITDVYYYLVKVTVNNQERFALSENPVDFTGTTPAVFSTFYDNNGQNEVTTKYNGSSITQVWLVSKNQSGQKPSITEACNAQNGVEIIDVSVYNGDFKNIYTVNGAADRAHYEITAAKKPAYKVTSVFEDSAHNPIAPAMAQGYYLVVKSGDKYYVETYDPAKEYEISQFFREVTGEGTGNIPTAYTNSSTIDEVYLVSKADAATAAAAASASQKITSGDVEIYTLAETPTSGQTTLTFTRKANADVYTTTVMFFDENAEIIEAAGDIGMHVDEAHSTKKAPALSKNYYVLATLQDKTDKSIAGWAINPVSLNGHTTTSTVFSEFIPFGENGSTTTGTKIPYYSGDDFPYTISTRLYRTDAALASPTYKTLVTDKTSNATDSPEDGYEFVGNWNPDDTHNEIHLKEASPKTYAVRVRFKASNIADLVAIGNDGYYVVHVIVTHADGTHSVQYDRLNLGVNDISALPVDDEGYLYKEFSFPYWRGTDGGYQVKTDSSPNPKFTGNEQNIKVELVKSSDNNGYAYNNYESTNSVKYAEGASAGAYVVHYDTRWTNPQSTLSRFHEEQVSGSDVVKCYDLIDLIKPDADSEYDYATILGPNYSYGIVADHLFHNNDLQTNFAVNHYTGHGDYVTPDLSNTSGTIVIGEFNRNTADMASNHVGPKVLTTSEDSEDIKAGTVPLGTNILGSLAIYADNDSGARYDTYGVAGGTPVSEERNLVHVFMQDGNYLQNQIVNPAIQYGVDMSRTLASKEATYTPEMIEGKPYVNTTGFPDNATIYIDADSMLSVGEGADDIYGTLYELRNLKIVKKPDQMLIFNFKNAINVRLNQFNVTYSDSTVNDFNTNTTTTHSDTNVTMENISKHIVWNFASCTRRVELSEVGGICLQPNYGSETQISGTSGGWLVSAGYVYNSSAEWHNFFQEVPKSTEVNLRVLKTVDGKVPAANEQFDFELYEYDVTSHAWETTYIAIEQNTRSSIKFTIEDPENTPVAKQKLTPGWHVYKIKETGKHTGEGISNLNYNYDTTEYYAAVLVTENGTARIAGSPQYFGTFHEAQFTSASVENFNVNAVFSDPLTTVTFENEVMKEGLTLHKTVEGTTSAKVPFTFKIEVWKDGTTPDGPTQALDNVDYLVSGLPSVSKITLTPNAAGTCSEGTLILRNGQTATIAGLPIGSHYKVTETHVNGTEIVYTGDTAAAVDGYTAQTKERIGVIVEGGVRADFTNVYEASGTATLKAHKELKNTTETLPEHAFGFELYHNGTQIGDTLYNDASGNVTFPALTFTEADMEGATLNPSTGKRTKVLTYRVHEINGNVSGFAYDQFINDADKTVIVTLLDEGDGTIRAVGLPTDFTFRFNNEKAIEVVLEGSKQLIGRDMKSGEVFRFIAKEGETIVATATLRDARDGEETAFSFTPIKYTAAGTHTYTISEFEGIAAQKLTFDSTTFTATVTVTETSGNLSASVVYSPDPVKFVNTSTETTSASIEKVWSDGNANHASDRVKVRLYKVYGNPVEAPAQAPTPYVPSENNTDAVPVTESDGLRIDLPTNLSGAVAIMGSEAMLSRANNWKYTWSRLPKIEQVDGTWKEVAYYPVEVWTSNTNVTATTYSLKDSTKTTTVTNTVAQNGSLKITKTVQVNGVAPTDATQSLVNGDYIFTVADASTPSTVLKYVLITVTNGVSASYKVANGPTTPDWSSITATSGGEAIVSNLPTGDYVITETAVTGMITTVSGGKNSENNTKSSAITVHVTAGDTAAEQATAQATFTNNKPYITAHPEVTKAITANGTVDNDKWPDSVSFGFVLHLVSAKESAVDGAADITGFTMADQTKTATKADKTAVFDDITFTQPGVYTFTITEQEPNPKPASYITYDTEPKTVTITVGTDTNGNLTTPVISYGGQNSLTVNNEYTASGTTTFEGTKTIVNRAFKNGDTLTVSITSSDGGRLPTDASSKTVVLTTDGTVNTANFSFAEVTYTYSDIADSTETPKSKTFHYTVTETATMAGTAADKRTHTIEVTVTDNGNGSLLVSKVYKANSDTEDKTNFTNTYDTSTTATISGTKEFTNGTIAADQFTFTLSADDGVPMPEGNGNTATAAAGTGAFSFGTITYQLSLFNTVTADEQGVKTLTYTYTVAEVLPDGVTAANPIKDGIRYNTESKTVTVTVTYNTKTGEIATSVSPATAEFTFTNEQLGDLTITKTMVGASLNDLTPEQKQNITFTVTGPNSYSNTIRLDQFTGGSYTIENLSLGAYTVVENNAAANAPTGYTFVSTQYVTANSAGTAGTATVAAGDTPAAVTVTNTYTRDTSYTPKVTKVLNQGEAAADASKWPSGGFDFTLAVTSNPENGATLGTATANAASASNPLATFGAVTFTKADTYTFTITETVPDDASNGSETWLQATTEQKAAGGFAKNGITYNNTPITLTVVVDEDTTTHELGVTSVRYGTAEAVTTNIDSASGTIVNTYDVTPTTYAPMITKTFSGTWPDDGFGFSLAASESNPTGAAMGGTTASATSGTPTATFADITFSAAETYSFTITETVPPDAVNAAGTAYSSADPKTGWFVKDGIAYDATPVTVQVIVEDNNQGVLSVTSVSYNGGTAATGDGIATAAGAITNKPVQTTKNASGTKVLTGRDWKDGETFTFTLTPDSTTVTAITAGTVVLPAGGEGYTVNENVITVTASKPATGNEQSFTFPNITFKTPGTYVFTMAEAVPDINERAANIAYASNTVTVTYTVAADADGDLSVTREYSNASVEGHASAAWFENVYTDSKPILFTVQKTLAGATTTDKTFTFTLKQVDAKNSTTQVTTKLAETQTTKITVNSTTTTAASNFNNTTVTFDQGDIGQSYWFLIEEDATGVDANGVKDGIKYDTTCQYWIKVSVTLGANDELVVTKYQSDETTVISAAPDASFTNTEMTSIYAKKIWTQNGTAMTGWPTGITNVTFQLQQDNSTEGNQNWVAVTTDALGTAINDVTVSNYDTVSFTNLPNDKQYRIVETKVNGQDTDPVIVAQGTGYGTASAPLTITNPISTTTVTVTKAWKKADGTDALPPAGTVITLGLYKEATQETPVSTITLNGIPEAATASEGVEAYPNGNSADNYEDSAWHATWTNLPVYEAEDGSAITYVVKETTRASGYTVSYGAAGATYVSTGGTITNTLNETSISVFKKDSTDNHALSGAQFTLYRVTTETVVPANEGEPTTRRVETPYPDATNSVKTTGNDGTITFTNLIDGAYMLVETQTPAGYNAQTQAIEFSISGGVVSYTAGSSSVSYESSTNTFTVPNTPGVELPATGGSGILPYTLTGLTLILGAALFLFLRRKREQN